MPVNTKLAECYGWRGKAYGPGPATIPDDLAIALGLSVAEPEPAAAPAPEQEPEQDTPPPPEPEPPLFPALVLINKAKTARSLTPIPTIGAKAAGILLEQRPAEGYPNMDALPVEIFAPPYNCDRDQIEAWEG